MALFAIRLQKPIRLNQHQPEGHCWSFPGMGELMCYSALGYIIGRTDTILCASFEKGTAEATAAGQVGCRHVREKMLNIGSGCCAYSQEKYECRGNYTCIGRLKYLHTTTTANRSRKERERCHPFVVFSTIDAADEMRVFPFLHLSSNSSTYATISNPNTGTHKHKSYIHVYIQASSPPKKEDGPGSRWMKSCGWFCHIRDTITIPTENNTNKRGLLFEILRVDVHRYKEVNTFDVGERLSPVDFMYVVWCNTVPPSAYYTCCLIWCWR
jgi:hypothetical protein